MMTASELFEAFELFGIVELFELFVRVPEDTTFVNAVAQGAW
jgi:hypothetical protein